MSKIKFPEGSAGAKAQTMIENPNASFMDKRIGAKILADETAKAQKTALKALQTPSVAPKLSVAPVQKPDVYKRLEDQIGSKYGHKFTVGCRVIGAYSDLHDEEDETPRNLNYFERESVDGEALGKIMQVAVPSYNGFDGVQSIARVVDAFGANAQYFIGREGSPVIYVKPAGRIWLNGRGPNFGTLADEVSFDSSLGMFRLWWD